MIIAFDMDGTLLNSQKEITPLTLKVLKMLKEAGHYLIPCTGRSLQGLPKVLLEDDLCNYGILSNGAIIYDILNDKPIFTSYFEPEEFVRIIDFLAPYKADIDYNADGKVFSDRDSWEHLERYHIQEELKPMIRSSRTIVEDIRKDILQHQRKVNRANLFFEDLELRQKLFDIREQLPFDLTTSVPGNGELTKKGINKGFAISFICDHLHLSHDEVIFFGDADNDKEALALDIHAVLMCNGDMNLRNLTDHMTQEDNDHDGLARYLISYFDLSL